MKKRLNPTNSRFGKLVTAASVTILAAALPLAAQVVIEGGPGTVQISDEDGKVEAAPLTSASAIEPVEAVPNGPLKKIDGSITVQPNALESTTVAVPAKPKMRTPIADVEPAPVGVIAATAEVDPKTVTVGPEVAQRMAELARKLSIQSTATGATLGMTTEGLYTEGTSAIDPLLDAQLSEIAEYIRLSQSEVVDVTYHYVPNEVSQDLAWKRSLSLVSWLKKKGLTVEQTYKIADPEAVVIETPDLTSPTSVTDTELTGRIELSMN